MSHSEHRPGVQVLLFMMAAALPLIFGAWMLAADEIPLWPGSMLLAASAFSMLVGVGFLLGTHQQVALMLREQGNQNRRLQEAHLERDRLNRELQIVSRQRRTLEQRQVNQNRAILQLARQFETIAGAVSDKVRQTEVDDRLRGQLAFLHIIGQDLVELLEVEVAREALADDSFVVDVEVQQLVNALQAQGQLPEAVAVDCEDTDISARSDRELFLRAIRQALVSLHPLSRRSPLKCSMISYLHAEMEDVIQFTFTATGFNLNDLDADQWFTHFQLHSDENGHYLGPGLGMLLLDRYAALLGGEVQVSAEINDELSVILTLPLRVQQDDDEMNP